MIYSNVSAATNHNDAVVDQFASRWSDGAYQTQSGGNLGSRQVSTNSLQIWTFGQQGRYHARHYTLMIRTRCNPRGCGCAGKPHLMRVAAQSAFSCESDRDFIRTRAETLKPAVFGSMSKPQSI